MITNQLFIVPIIDLDFLAPCFMGIVYSKYIGIGFRNFATLNPIVLLYGIVFRQIQQSQIPFFFVLDSIVFGSRIRWRLEAIVFSVVNLNRRVPLKVRRSYHPA